MYKVKAYQEQIYLKDADTQKRYGLIEKLSKNFTVENSIALEMDKLLAEQLELEKQPNKDNKITETASKNIQSQSNSGTSDLEKKFNELFIALKNHTGDSTPINEEHIKAIVNDVLRIKKIGFDNLDTFVQELLSRQPQIIKYELPDSRTADFEKPEIEMFQLIMDDVMLGSNVMLVGGAGTGKTFLAENLVSKALGRPSITINCSQWTSPTEIIGGQTMDGYVEGKLIEAWQKGYILILDELPKIDPNTAGLFNDALAKTKIPNAVIFNSRKESFSKHKNFGCIATGNIYPDKESMSYGANNKQDLSLLDRFSGSVYFIEKNPGIEKRVVQNNMIWSICNKVRNVIEEMRYEAQLSLRLMQNVRDGYLLEMQRVNDKGKNGVKADEGKTFKSTIDNYLSTFTDLQRKNIRERIRYNEVFTRYEYRNFDITKEVY